MLNILLTGSNGFIGSNFIKLSPEFKIFEADLLKTNVSEIDFYGIDTVLHLAAIVHQKKSISESIYYSINRDLAYDLAISAKSKGVRQFILMSTSKVYGDSTKDDNIFNEFSDCFPLDSYGKSKLEAEKKVMSLNDDFFKVSVIRSPIVFGPGVKANMLNLLKLVDCMPIIPLKDTENKRSIVYIGNLVSLIKKIISSEPSGIFIASDSEPVSTSYIIERINEYLAKNRRIVKIPTVFTTLGKILFPTLMDRLYGSFVLENSATNSILNFSPPYSTDEGIKNMVEWYLQNKSRTGSALLKAGPSLD